MSAERYTKEQILSGIRIIWREELGCDDSFDLNSRIDAYHSSDSLGDCEVIFEIEKYFGFSCLVEEWNRFFGLSARSREEWEQKFAPNFTFRRLVEFIEEHVKPISFEPITLLGKPCLTAGIFRGMEQLVREISPRTPRFAPSTPIRDRLRGTRLHVFWNRLRWMLEDQIPPAPRITLSSRGLLQSLFVKLGIGVLIALWRRDLSGILAGIGTTFALLFPLGVIVGFINTHLNPLPKGIETFGDLARVLAAIILDQQNEAASCSTP